MITRLKRRLITVVMCSLTAVLFAVMAVINISVFIDLDADASALLNILAENDGFFPKLKPSGRPDVRFRQMSPETPYATRFFTVRYDNQGGVISADTGSIAAIDADGAIQYASSAIAHGRKSGYADDYKYLVSDTPDGKLAVFLDCSRELSAFRTFLASCVLASLGGLLAVFLLILYFSGRAIRPIAESYEKQKCFITNAGHEIKTPLTIIDASTEVLELTQGENEWTNSIRNQVSRLSSLTEQLVSLSRLDEGRDTLVKAPFSMTDAVEETAELFIPLAKARGRVLKIEAERDIDFCGSESSVRQLVSVLLDNAVKYSTSDEPIVLSLSKRGRSIVLSCRNAAENTDKNMLNMMFERFYRADTSRASQISGYGIGLSLARAIVEAHGGEIKASSPSENIIVIRAVF